MTDKRSNPFAPVPGDGFHHDTTTGRLAAPGKQASNAKARPRDASRQSIDAQIKALSAKIRENVNRVGNLARRGKHDDAARVCTIVAQQRGTLLGLVEQYEARQKAEPTAAIPRLYRPATSVSTKRKTHKRWADK